MPSFNKSFLNFNVILLSPSKAFMTSTSINSRYQFRTNRISTCEYMTVYLYRKSVVKTTSSEKKVMDCVFEVRNKSNLQFEKDITLVCSHVFRYRYYIISILTSLNSQ